MAVDTMGGIGAVEKVDYTKLRLEGVIKLLKDIRDGKVDEKAGVNTLISELDTKTSSNVVPGNGVGTLRGLVRGGVAGILEKTGVRETEYNGLFEAVPSDVIFSQEVQEKRAQIERPALVITEREPLIEALKKLFTQLQNMGFDSRNPDFLNLDKTLEGAGNDVTKEQLLEKVIEGLEIKLKNHNSKMIGIAREENDRKIFPLDIDMIVYSAK